MLKRAIGKMRGTLAGRLHLMPWKPGKGPRGDEKVEDTDTVGAGRRRRKQRGGSIWTPPEELERRKKQTDREAFWQKMAGTSDPNRLPNRVLKQGGVGRKRKRVH